MFSKWFKRASEPPLELKVGEQTLAFTSLREFDFSLSSRVDVPASKLSQMVKFTDAELMEEITGIRDVRQHFVKMLLKSIEKHDSISHSLRMLEPTLFSNDHQWRKLVAALNANPETPDSFKRVAMVKYLQYLHARQDLARSIYRERRPGETGEEPPEMRERSVLSMARIEGDRIAPPAPGGEITRLPKGEKVTLRVREGDEVYVFLSKQPYKLRREKAHETLTLVDENGNEQVLHHGLNVIGRGSGSDVVVDRD